MTDDEIKAFLALKEKARPVCGIATPKTASSRLVAGLVLGDGPNRMAEIYELERIADVKYICACWDKAPQLAREVLRLREQVRLYKRSNEIEEKMETEEAK